MGQALSTALLQSWKKSGKSKSKFYELRKKQVRLFVTHMYRDMYYTCLGLACRDTDGRYQWNIHDFLQEDFYMIGNTVRQEILYKMFIDHHIEKMEQLSNTKMKGVCVECGNKEQTRWFCVACSFDQYGFTWLSAHVWQYPFSDWKYLGLCVTYTCSDVRMTLEASQNLVSPIFTQRRTESKIEFEISHTFNYFQYLKKSILILLIFKNF